MTKCHLICPLKGMFSTTRNRSCRSQVVGNFNFFLKSLRTVTFSFFADRIFGPHELWTSMRIEKSLPYGSLYGSVYDCATRAIFDFYSLGSSQLVPAAGIPPTKTVSLAYFYDCFLRFQWIQYILVTLLIWSVWKALHKGEWSMDIPLS